MDWMTIATLIAKYGLPFVDKLISNAANNTPVTPDEWQKQRALIETPFDALCPPKVKVS